MTADIPVACTLSAGGQADQHERWQRLMTRALTGRTDTPDGLRLFFRAEAEDEVRALAAVEAQCCAWAAWSVEPTAGAVMLDVRSVVVQAGGATAVRAMFGGDAGQAGG